MTSPSNTPVSKAPPPRGLDMPTSGALPGAVLGTVWSSTQIKAYPAVAHCALAAGPVVGTT
ncbi:hypothetical protein ACFCWG_37135 [Streptomyces sp. NPDC056390]|uniref:hypothetical protein n=1 Tax=Streptomyces sp. NPDC056390 TaxID=3345806 RepID=UPI0035E15F22